MSWGLDKLSPLPLRPQYVPDVFQSCSPTLQAGQEDGTEPVGPPLASGSGSTGPVDSGSCVGTWTLLVSPAQQPRSKNAGERQKLKLTDFGTG